MALVKIKPAPPTSSSESHSQYANELAGLVTIGVALFTLASFASYHLGFESRWGGVLGVTLAHTLARLFGYAVYVIPFALVVLAVRFFRGGLTDFPLSRLGAWLLMLVLVSGMLGLLDPSGTHKLSGWFGGFVGTLLLSWCGLVGAWVGLAITVLTTVSYIAGTTPLRLIARWRQRSALRIRAAREATATEKQPSIAGWLPGGRHEEDDGPIITLPEPKGSGSKQSRKNMQPALPLFAGDHYQLPPLSLLDTPPASERLNLNEELLRRSAEILETKLAHFGIEAHVVAVVPGPVITTFEIELAPGIKVNRVASLQDDLSMALRSPVRIVAPVPGKSVVGIEVANQRRERVYLSEILGSHAFQAASSLLTLALGKDSAGTPRVEDLARMPHLLIAGATGTGKSVFLNALIMSILSKASPRDVRFVMIDLKMLELPLYEGLPHQLVPVVTDTKTALIVLNNLCREMDHRYALLKDKGVRNIDAYNALLAREAQEGIIDLGDVAVVEDGGGEASSSTNEAALGAPTSAQPAHAHMPKIVIIIDELADLMMTSGRNVEAPIIRLAQKARACGMHLIVATQRPSVDVITGLIKANFPARVSFQVASRTDSRTILDCMGAERLLGEGDMLFLQPGRGMERLHGAFVAEKEIHRVVEFVKRQAEPEYALALLENTATEEGSGNLPGEGEGGDSDELYDQAVQIVTETRIASISYLQRRLRIGYNRAARLIERMEHEGIVSRSENGRPREVLAMPPPEP